MTSDAEDDALSWEGDDERPEARASLPRGWRAVGKDSGRIEQQGATDGADAAPSVQLSSGMLLAVGVFGGVYALYIVGWIIGGLNLRGLSSLFLADGFYTPWIAFAALGTALWLPAVWLLTRGKASWMRILLLIIGVVLLVPWPLVMPWTTVLPGAGA